MIFPRQNIYRPDLPGGQVQRPAASGIAKAFTVAANPRINPAAARLGCSVSRQFHQVHGSQLLVAIEARYSVDCEPEETVQQQKANTGDAGKEWVGDFCARKTSHQIQDLD